MSSEVGGVQLAIVEALREGLLDALQATEDPEARYHLRQQLQRLDLLQAELNTLENDRAAFVTALQLYQGGST